MIPIRRRWCRSFRNIPVCTGKPRPRWAALRRQARAGDPDLVVPAAKRSRYEAAFARFAPFSRTRSTFSERGRYFPDDSEDKGRLLSAGYHNVMGYFRDDTPLMRADPGRKRPEGAEPAVGRVRLHRRLHRRAPGIQYYFNQSGEVDGKGAESGRARPLG